MNEATMTNERAGEIEARLVAHQERIARSVSTGEHGEDQMIPLMLQAMMNEGLVEAALTEAGQLGYALTDLGVAFGENRKMRGFGQLLGPAAGSC